MKSIYNWFKQFFEPIKLYVFSIFVVLCFHYVLCFVFIWVWLFFPNTSLIIAIMMYIRTMSCKVTQMYLSSGQHGLILRIWIIDSKTSISSRVPPLLSKSTEKKLNENILKSHDRITLKSSRNLTSVQIIYIYSCRNTWSQHFR